MKLIVILFLLKMLHILFNKLMIAVLLVDGGQKTEVLLNQSLQYHLGLDCINVVNYVNNGLFVVNINNWLWFTIYVLY